MFEITEQDNITIVKMCHGKVNAMDIEFCDQMISTLHEFGEQRRPLVLTGNRAVFSAGVDLKRLIDETETYLDEFLDKMSEMFLTMFEYPAPTVAAINGAAIAGGCILASGCDYRIISPAGRIGIPELRIGVALPIVAIEIMRFVAAPQKFQQMISIGATWTGDGAVEAGLADETCDRKDQLELAVQKAGELATIPKEVYRVCKQQMRAPSVRNMVENLKQFGGENRQLWHDPENQAVVRAYVEERLTSKKN
ncbi:MAG: enoyl-CoA hydratase-related protein [Planctomycetota bacterium]